MPIKPFNFPGVTLTQEFTGSNIGTEAVLSVACIGRPYYLHRADVESEAAVTDVIYVVGSTTAAIDLPGLVTEIPLSGGTAYVAPVIATGAKVFVEDGVFQHVQITSVNKAFAATDKAAVKVDCKKNVKSGSGATADPVFGTREVEVGDSVAITGTSVSGIGVVTGISKSATTGGLGEVTLDLTGATVGASGGTISSFWFLVEDDAELVRSTTGNPSGLVIDTSDDSFQLYEDVGATNLDGTSTFCALTGGTYSVAVQYKQENKLYDGKLGQVYNADDVDAVLGGACLDNPLALAVKIAAEEAPNTIVYFTAPKTENLAGYREAVDFLEKYEEIYSIVPLTNDSTIIAALLTDVTRVSEDEESKVRRALWYALDPELDDDTKTNWIAGSTATNADRVEDVKNARHAVPNSYKSQAVWSDMGGTRNGELLPNYFLAAAAAGQRAYQPCQRPLSNLTYSSFTLTEPHGFTKSQLKAIGAEGVWIIGNNQDDIPINMRQVTTAVANNINLDEESIVANADEIALGLCHIGETRVGCSNISPTMIMALSDDITLLMDSKLINRTGSEYIGAQLLSWSLDTIYQDPIHKDRIYAVISCEPPKPFNEFKMTLRII